MFKKGYSYPIRRKYPEIKYSVLLGSLIISPFSLFVNRICNFYRNSLIALRITREVLFLVQTVPLVFVRFLSCEYFIMAYLFLLKIYINS